MELNELVFNKTICGTITLYTTNRRTHKKVDTISRECQTQSSSFTQLQSRKQRATILTVIAELPRTQTSC